MKDWFKAEELDQIWDELRKKIRDAKNQLPPGVLTPMVRDDFGDVYGVFFALHGKDYSYTQLKEYAKYLKKELLLCQDVARIEFWGIQQESIYIEFNRAQIARLGISMAQIYQTLNLQNRVEPSGTVDVDSKYMRIQPTGEFVTEQEIADLLIAGRSGNMIRLGEIAHIKREYPDPPRNLMRFNGKPAIGIGISTVAKGNVVVMGEAIQKKLAQLSEKQPKGMTLDVVYYQSEVVNEALDVFLTNLIQAVAIVILLLLVFMGWRSGLIIGFILLLTIMGTFIGMFVMGIDLQKISLGALILALGMLVDNAIVVAEGILVGITRKEGRKQAAIRVVHENAWPLLGATLVAILAFAAIGFAPGNTGEFCRSLFDVMAISLGFSWVTAVTLTPLLCVKFLKVPANADVDPYKGRLYRIYQKTLSLALRFRLATIVLAL
ncbi:MAG: acriflavin resistance protein, partial [Desulfobacterales bacterium]